MFLRIKLRYIFQWKKTLTNSEQMVKHYHDNLSLKLCTPLQSESMYVTSLVFFWILHKSGTSHIAATGKNQKSCFKNVSFYEF
jgi:hypothetical protein